MTLVNIGKWWSLLLAVFVLTTPSLLGEEHHVGTSYYYITLQRLLDGNQPEHLHGEDVITLHNNDASINPEISHPLPSGITIQSSDPGVTRVISPSNPANHTAGVFYMKDVPPGIIGKLNLKDIAITGGQAGLVGYDGFGGAIASFVEFDLKTYGNSRISGNSATGGSNRNYAYTFGGGIYAYRKMTLEVSGSMSFDNNTAQGGDDSWDAAGIGGGIFGYQVAVNAAAGGSLSITNNTAQGGASGVYGNWYWDNLGYAQGGGVFSRLHQSYTGSGGSYAITENTAQGGDYSYDAVGMGGGLYIGTDYNTNENGNLWVETGSFTVSDNIAQGGQDAGTYSDEGSIGEYYGYAEGSGGGIYSRGGVFFNNTKTVLISGNKAAGGNGSLGAAGSGGGGIYSMNRVEAVNSNVTIADNTATAGDNAATYAWASGGGIRVNAGSFSFSGNGALKITDNTAQGGQNAGSEAFAQGGGVFALGDITLSGSGGHLFQDNKALGGSLASSDDNYTTGGRGGAIYTRGNLNITGARFLDNRADSISNTPSVFNAGGAIFADYNESQGGVSTHTLRATAAQPIVFQGNTHHHSGSAPTANSIFFGNTIGAWDFPGTSTTTLNVVVDHGAEFLMYDPMGSQADDLDYGDGVNSYNNVELTIEKTGAGVWLLGGGNVMGSKTAVNVRSGTLELFAGGAKGGAGSIVLAGKNSSFTLGGNGILVAGGVNAVTANGAGGAIQFDDGAIIAAGGASTTLTMRATGGVIIGTLAADRLEATADNGRKLTLDAAFTGNGVLEKTGAGTVVLTGVNDNSGGVMVSAGTLALAGSGGITSAGGVQMAANTVFDISGVSGASATLSRLDVEGTGASLALGGKTLDMAGKILSFNLAGIKAGGGPLLTANSGLTMSAGTTVELKNIPFRLRENNRVHLAEGLTAGSSADTGTEFSSGRRTYFLDLDSSWDLYAVLANTVSFTDATNDYLKQLAPGNFNVRNANAYLDRLLETPFVDSPGMAEIDDYYAAIVDTLPAYAGAVEMERFFGAYAAYANTALASDADRFRQRWRRQNHAFLDKHILDSLPSGVAGAGAASGSALASPVFPAATASRFWADGFGSWSEQGGENGLSGYTYESYGFALGYEYARDRLSLGFAGAYSRGNLKVNTLGYQNRADALNLALHGAYVHESGLYAEGGLGYGHAWNEYDALMLLGGWKSGSHGSDIFSADLEFGYIARLPRRVTLVPSVGVEYAYTRNGAWTENVSGGSLALANSFSSGGDHALDIPVGLRANTIHRFGARGVIVPELRAAYVYSANTLRPSIQSGFGGVPGGMVVRGVDPGRGHWRLGAGLSGRVGDCVDFRFDYAFETRSGFRGHNLGASVGLSF